MRFMVFDLMDADLFRVWRDRRRLLPIKLAEQFLRHLVEGVAHLHGLNIVHADLSMGNLLLKGVGAVPALSHAEADF